jgi:glycosyltransferase involved in cell wall biosynthesis
MRILLTCDPEIPVPPTLYGGVERLVDGLAHAYREQGHEVYLLANPKSSCTAAIEIFHFPALQSRGYSNVAKNALKLYRVAKKIKPDVIHSFSRLLYTYPLLLSSKIPFLQTYGRLISPKSTRLASIVGGRKMNFTSAAAHMLNHLPDKRKFTPVYNFIDTNFYVPDDTVEKSGLVFLGRIEDIKGTKESIEVALAVQMKLTIAGNVPDDQLDYFQQFVEPYLQNPLIEYVGPVNDQQKRALLQKAKASILPFKLKHEAFGITIIESMACGTPVVTFEIAATPEIIKHGVTGFLASSLDELIACTQSIESIDRVEVRNDCVKRFSREVISQQYSELLNEISGGN